MRPLWRRLLDHLGLVPPYRFERTIPALFLAILAITVGALYVHFRAVGMVHWGTPRGWHFVYMATLLAVAAVFLKRGTVVAICLSLCFLDVGLGVGSLLLKRMGISTGHLFPTDDFENPQVWHPLLQAVMRRNFQTPSFHTNAAGLRGRDRDPADLATRIVVALVGGSSTHDFVSPDGQSWGDRLEQLLNASDVAGRRYAVLNHGMGGYTTAEHVLQTAFYQDTYGIRPSCAVYYIGWNDLRNVRIAHLEPGYADFHIPNMVDTFAIRRLDIHELAASPALKLLSRLAILALDTARPAVPVRSSAEDISPDFEQIYRQHIHMISAINRGRGVRTIWVGQLMNRDALTGDDFDPWIIFVRKREVWPLMQRLNEMVRTEALALGDPYVDVPIEQFGRADFADVGHFLPSGSLKFAKGLVATVRSTCQPSR
jgi:hypothetical protein